jgi:hypothetical protein
MSSQEGFAPQLGRLQIPQGLVPRPTQVADGCIVEGRDRDGGEVPRAHKPGQWHGVTPVGFDPVAWLLGNQGGGDDPADRALFPQGAIEPIAAGARFIDEDALLPLRLQLP